MIESELRKEYIGFVYEYPKAKDFILLNGAPETLKGTNGITWIVYFPKGGITLIINKKTNIVENVYKGKKEGL